jgi:RNase H-like domain found in reverse transcriptase
MFFTQLIKFLGFVISKDGISPKPSCIKTITNWIEPYNLKTLQSLLGTCNYLRSYVLNYSEGVNELHKLIQLKIKNIEMTEDARSSFYSLKKLFSKMEDVFLHTPTEYKQLALIIDSSNIAVGSVLYAVENLNIKVFSVLSDKKISKIENVRLCGFSSKMLNTSERNYPVINKEFKAIVAAVEHFSPLIRSSQKMLWILTDHKNLLFFTSMSLTWRQHFTWWSILTAYQFQI